MRTLVLLLAVAAALFVAVPAYAASDVLEKGYITLADGTELAYMVHLPSATGRFPVALIFDHYGDGASDPALDTGSNAAGLTLLKHGYAVLGVNERGSGCSSGENNWVDAAQWGKDGAEVVEWAAAQSWSIGHVGMFGISWPGITQIGVAGHRPRHLDAIAPFMITTDFYRDTAYPGGIYDAEFMSIYGALVPVDDVEAANVTRGSFSVDTGCATDYTTHAVLNAPDNTAVNMPQHPFLDSYWANDPNRYVDDIDVPVLGCQAWQDGVVSSRGAELYMYDFNPATTWFIGRNGSHMSVSCGMAETRAMVVKFFDHYVKGIANGWESTPHVTLLHEVQGSTPTWTSTLWSWHAVRPVTYRLHGDGTIDKSRPGPGEANSTYASVGPSWGDGVTWQAPRPPGTYAVYTSAPLTRDTEVLGPASVNLWLSSTAPDTDVEAIISEVRPDGSDQFIASGWLDMSQRKLDPAQSTALRPVQTHLEADQSLLTPGVPVLGRVEVFPFEHVFPAGSRIELTIDAAAGAAAPSDDFRGFGPTPPAVNTIYQDSKHESELVLGLVPGAKMGAPEPACGSVTSEPCRSPTP